MSQAIFLFEGNLNHFLAANRKQKKFTHNFKNRVSIKDMIESLGIPHPEVNAILVNEQEVDFNYLVKNGDEIVVYPLHSTFKPEHPLIPPLSTIDKFILDVHLGKLAGDLRLLGFDTLYRNDYADEELAAISSRENRIVLTRDRGVLMRSLVTYGYYVRSTNPQHQIIEVGNRFNLFDLDLDFSRCIKCNGLLEPIEKALIVHKIPEQVQKEVDNFSHCTNCNQIYWQGSHYKKLKDFIAVIKTKKQ